MATRDPVWHSRELAMTTFAGGQKRAVKAPVTLPTSSPGSTATRGFPRFAAVIYAPRSPVWPDWSATNQVKFLLDMPAIGRALVAATPATAGLSAKTIANIRSDFLAAMKGKWA